MNDQTSRPNPSVKQQRAAARAEKLEAARREQARADRNRRIWIWGGSVAAVVVIAAIVLSVVLTPRTGRYTAGGDGTEIPGVVTFQNGTAHVTTPVNYPQSPPTGGDHNPVWLNCGVYEEPVPNENAVHSLEHGAVWVTYDPAVVSDADVDRIRSIMPSGHSLLSPYEGMDTPVAITGWNAQLKMDAVDTDLLAQFFEEYWLSEDVPEPGAACVQGYDAPGKVA